MVEAKAPRNQFKGAIEFSVRTNIDKLSCEFLREICVHRPAVRSAARNPTRRHLTACSVPDQTVPFHLFQQLQLRPSRSGSNPGAPQNSAACPTKNHSAFSAFEKSGAGFGEASRDSRATPFAAPQPRDAGSGGVAMTISSQWRAARTIPDKQWFQRYLLA